MVWKFRYLLVFILFLDLDTKLHKGDNFVVLMLNLLLTHLFAATFFFGKPIDLLMVDELVVVAISFIIGGAIF